jgi:3-hydroxyisobutyrate dehydrogenase-like beta-hydroxyacid dehydrogenase
MAQRIIDEGVPTTLWARRPANLEQYAQARVTFAATLGELGAASDVLCVCVVADRDVDLVLRDRDGALDSMEPGGIVVIHSTVHPDTCRRLQSDHPHLHFLDAPVSGGGHMAAARQLLVMVGGDVRALEQCRPVLEAFADPLVHLGALGTGQEAKLLNNAVFIAQLGLTSDAFTTAIARGLDPTALAVVLAAGSARSYAAELVARGDYDLSGLAQLVGPLLAKDVDVLKRLLVRQGAGLTDAAEATLKTMGVAGPEDSGL